MRKTTFDYAALKAGFQEACQRRGVNPETGATSYQVALIKADLAKARAWRRCSSWWMHSSLWFYRGALNATSLSWKHLAHKTVAEGREDELDPLNVKRVRIIVSRPTENEAFSNVFVEAYAAELDRKGCQCRQREPAR